MTRAQQARLTYKKGIWGEYAACFFLMCKGYRIKKRRFKTKVGEIDIIAERGGTVCFVEVKHYHSFERGIYAITPKQQQRLHRAAEWYQTKYHITAPLRFDAIILVSWQWPWHIKNILIDM